jgi:hypothetical protein
MLVPSRAIFDGESFSPRYSEGNKLTRVAFRTNRIVAEVPSGTATATGFVALVLPVPWLIAPFLDLTAESRIAFREPL